MVTAPAEINAANASELRAILFEWQSRGHAVVVDLTGTQFCDSAGLRELVWAHKRAVADAGGLRLVIPAEGVVLRIFTVTGLEGIIPRFATVEQALAEIPAAASRPRRRGRSPGPAAAAASLPPDRRGCEQRGAVFVPRREHARFCSGECRAAFGPAVTFLTVTGAQAASATGTSQPAAP